MDVDFSLALQQLQDLVNSFINSAPSILIGWVILVASYYIAGHPSLEVAGLATKSGRPKNLSVVRNYEGRRIVIANGYLFSPSTGSIERTPSDGSSTM